MLLILFLNFILLNFVEPSRILVCVPCPSISHQVLFYPLITEFLNRGHEVVFITTDPMYPKGKAPTNLTEIDTHEVSYKVWLERVLSGSITRGRKDDAYRQASEIIPAIGKSFEQQMLNPEVQKLIKEKAHFDLLVVEGVSKSAHVLSHIFKAPMILMNSLGALQTNYRDIGAPIYPKLLYPIYWHQKLYNLTIFDKIRVLWDTYQIERIFDEYRVEENKVVKRLFGPDTPDLEDLSDNIAMLFLNIYPIWEHNRPVPPGVLFIGGMHQKPQKELPKDLKAYLDASKNGVIYFSMGTNVKPSALSEEKVQAIVNGLARLNYDVLVKWDHEELPGKGKNTKVTKWLPQSDLLHHPKIKAFITQGGLQSFDEALTAGVPLIGIPMLADQWYNVERYAALKIGVGLLMEELTEDKLVNAVNTVAGDPSYRRNMVDLRSRLHDQPDSALSRAVWWSEHVIRHKGAAHLRARTANISWREYLDLELLVTLALAALTALAVAVTTLYFLLQYIKKLLNGSVKIKSA